MMSGALTAEGSRFGRSTNVPVLPGQLLLELLQALMDFLLGAGIAEEQ